MAGPFKMKGSPMQRNFGIGSPLHQNDGEKTTTADKLRSAWYTSAHHDGGKASSGEKWKTYSGKKKEMRAFRKALEEWEKGGKKGKRPQKPSWKSGF